MSDPLRVATYNVHGGVPVDGAFDPRPACQVIRSLDADILALQEVVHGRFNGLRHDAFLAFAEAHGGHEVHGPTQHTEKRIYGNMLLSRWPILEHRIHEISVKRREPRNVIDAIVDAPVGKLRVLATHLGVKASERGHQARRLAEIVEADTARPLLVMGDFNDWLPLSFLSRTLRKVLTLTPRRSTYPAALPVLALDRIWVHPTPKHLELETVRRPPARRASDHLPLLGKIAW